VRISLEPLKRNGFSAPEEKPEEFAELRAGCRLYCLPTIRRCLFAKLMIGNPPVGMRGSTEALESRHPKRTVSKSECPPLLGSIVSKNRIRLVRYGPAVWSHKHRRGPFHNRLRELSLARDLLGAIERKLHRSNAQILRVGVCSGRQPVSCQNAKLRVSALSAKARE
jgi:hypothetical protein